MLVWFRRLGIGAGRGVRDVGCFLLIRRSC